MEKTREDKILDACQHVFDAMEKTKIPAKSMPELSEALYLLRAVVTQIRIEAKNSQYFKDKH